MTQIFGRLRIAESNGQALLTASGGRLAIRPGSLLQSAGLIRAFGWRRLPDVASYLDTLGLTLSFDSRAGVALVLGREASPGRMLRALGARRVALRWGARADSP